MISLLFYFSTYFCVLLARFALSYDFHRIYTVLVPPRKQIFALAQNKHNKMSALFDLTSLLISDY